jgi:Zn-dependent M28 family amino/carboxypeptidase
MEWVRPKDPEMAPPQPFDRSSVIELLHRHVKHLSVDIGDRYLWKESSLERASKYIALSFESSGYAVERQTFSCYGKTVSNLVVRKAGREREIIVVGAHYDTVPGSPGADDNASGVAVLLELARLHKEGSNHRTLLFAAFANEEPPFFGSSNMGSMVCTKDLRDQNAPVELMISLEMVGYYSRKPIQGYPLPGMGFFYPRTGDYIGVAGNFPSFRHISAVKRGIRKHSKMKARSLAAPEFFGGINLSDNYSFWHHGYRAVMVTDTSFFRNKNYHQETDTIETLDFESMAELTRGLYYTLLEL